LLGFILGVSIVVLGSRWKEILVVFVSSSKVL